MTSLRAEIEPLLARVAKPAHSIGPEDGISHPQHHHDNIAWLAHLDRHEIGLNHGLQIRCDEGLSLDWYAFRRRYEDEMLPWAHLTAGLPLDTLSTDWPDGLTRSGVEDCRWMPCYDSGVCIGHGIQHVMASPVCPAAESQRTGHDLASGHESSVSLGARP